MIGGIFARNSQENHQPQSLLRRLQIFVSRECELASFTGTSLNQDSRHVFSRKSSTLAKSRRRPMQALARAELLGANRDWTLWTDLQLVMHNLDVLDMRREWHLSRPRIRLRFAID